MSLCGAQGATKAQETLLPDQATLHAQAIEESMIPIRPGVPGKSPFWNRYARMFAYVPSFEFTKVPGAVHYRFTATAKADGKDYVFVVANPWATLAPIWPDVPVGDVALKVEGLGREGQVLGLAGTQAFYRAAVFNGPYGKPLMEYRQSARRALESMYRQKYVRNWKVNGKPDEASNSLYSYPDILIGGGVVPAMRMFAQLSSGAEAQDSLHIANIAAKYLISISEPAGAPLAHIPPTYTGRGFNAERKGQIMLYYAAYVSGHYLDLFDVTKDDALFTAATRMADTLIKTQRADGSWPLQVEAKTGKPLSKNLSLPVDILLHCPPFRYTSGYGDVIGGRLGVRPRSAARRASLRMPRGPVSSRQVPAGARRGPEMDHGPSHEDVQLVRPVSGPEHRGLRIQQSYPA
jgi:maltose/maltodextrin transport system substrate-binding protein